MQDRGSDTTLHTLLTPLLAFVAISVYALVLTGAVTSLLDAAAGCSTWPTCDGTWLVPLSETDALIAMGHRVATLVVAVVLIATTLIAWYVHAPRMVTLSLLAVVGIYPVQVALGALATVGGERVMLSGLHLLLAMAIFAGVLLALLYWLEWETRHVTSTYHDPRQSRRGVTAATPGAEMDIGIRETATAYLRLTKPRLMWLLCIVALAGMGLASAATEVALSWSLVIGTLLGGVLAIGASGTFNQVIERDIDRQMARTADRPVPQEVVPIANAVAFGFALTVLSLAVFLWLVNPLAAGLGLLAIAFYSIGYTLILKPHTTHNIVIGGAVGAFPALIGWAAVSESIGLPAIVLGGVIFLWTPAHFYNLALVYKTDYAQGGFPMLPIVRGEVVTRRHIGGYLGATLVGVGLLGAISAVSWLYALTALLGAIGFLIAVIHLYRQQTRSAAFRTFHMSNIFLGSLMLVIVLETIVL